MKIACQTFSSSVADAIEFMMLACNPSFKNGTIEFIRIIDRLFDLLNVRNPYGKGFKQPLRTSNEIIWNETIDNSIDYLLTLKSIDGTPLILHRRKTFIVGFITAALSTRMLALELMRNNDFQYILTYKYS